jgi:hypothetical protein
VARVGQRGEHVGEGDAGSRARERDAAVVALLRGQQACLPQLAQHLGEVMGRHMDRAGNVVDAQRRPIAVCRQVDHRAQRVVLTDRE